MDDTNHDSLDDSGLYVTVHEYFPIRILHEQLACCVNHRNFYKHIHMFPVCPNASQAGLTFTHFWFFMSAGCLSPTTLTVMATFSHNLCTSNSRGLLSPYFSQTITIMHRVNCAGVAETDSREREREKVAGIILAMPQRPQKYLSRDPSLKCALPACAHCPRMWTDNQAGIVDYLAA